MEGFTKTLVSGSEDCVIMGVREAFVRETNLPTNWTRCRIMAFVSVTTSTDPNVNSTHSEVIIPATVRDLPFIGMTNGAGHFTGSTSDFVGFSWYNPNGMFYGLRAGSNPAYRLPLSADGGFHQAIRNGVGSAWGSSISGSGVHCYTPGDTTNFACLIGVDISVSGEGVMRIGIIMATNISDVSTPYLRSVGGGTYSYATATAAGHGWWSVTNNIPVGCRHVCLYSPAQYHRLRIHALEVVQLT